MRRQKKRVKLEESRLYSNERETNDSLLTTSIFFLSLTERYAIAGVRFYQLVLFLPFVDSLNLLIYIISTIYKFNYNEKKTSNNNQLLKLFR
jgi:hypothetical protein